MWYRIKKLSYFDSTLRQHINIETILLTRESFNILFIHLANQHLFFISKVESISIKKLRKWTEYHVKNLIQKSFIFDENFVKSLSFIIFKIFFLLFRWWTQYQVFRILHQRSLHQKRQESSSETLFQHSAFSYSHCLKIFKNHIYLSSKSSFFSRINDDVRITKNEDFNFKSLSIMSIKLRELLLTSFSIFFM